MASLIKGIFIDVNKSVEVCVKIDGKALSFDLIYPKEKEADVGFRNYISNIKKMLKVEYHKGQDGKIDGIGVYLGRFKLGEITSFQLFGMIDKNAKYNAIHYINSTEERFLSQGNLQNIENLGVPFERHQTKTPLTDLHTHLSGALTADDIVHIATKFNSKIDINLLAKAGIDIQKYESVYDVTERKDSSGKAVKVIKVAFNDLTEEDKNIYKSKLSIKVNAQETFGAMEDCYSFRHPIVRLSDSQNSNFDVAELFKEQLRCLAKHYQKTGVKYAELSMSEICKNPEVFLSLIDKVMPEIESEFPDVTLRFLGAIPRTLDKAGMKLRNANLLASASSPYVVGLDVMAHEVNQTNYFSEIIEDCLKYSTEKNDPNFVIRVHAGESDVHYNNVKQFLKIVDKHCTATGSKPPVIRIGHGIHGFDDETIALAVKLNAIIEINLSSNLALNNVDSLTEVVLKKYKDMGLRVYISTDGHGMYSTDSHQETELALAAGLTAQNVDELVEDEASYIDSAKRSSIAKKASERKQKMNYLIELAENIREKLSYANITLEQIRKMPIKEAAKKLMEINLSVVVGKINILTQEEFEEILKKDILSLDRTTAREMFTGDAEILTSNMPVEYYLIHHRVDRELAEDLTARSERAKARDKTVIKSNTIQFKSYMKGGSRQVQVVEQDKPIPSMNGRKPVCVVGYVDSQWDELTPAAREELITEATELIAALDPNKTFLITSTAKDGFNEVLIEIVRMVNPKLKIMGLFHEEQLKTVTENELKWIKRSFSMVKVQKGNQFAYSTELADYLKEHDGDLIAFGDGSHLKDHIINLHNKNGSVHLYNGKYSSSSKVDFLQGNGYDFADTSELLEQMEISSRVSERDLKKVLERFQGKIQNPNQKI